MIDIGSLWQAANANSVPLFRTSQTDPLLALFDKRGFYFSDEAKSRYQQTVTIGSMSGQLRDLPHLYVARLASEDHYYIGKSNQKRGRWQRGHYYHLGIIAHTILDTIKPVDQNHHQWVESWFQPSELETIEREKIGPHFAMRLREPVVISFYPYPEDSLLDAETALIHEAQSQNKAVLNIKKRIKAIE